MTFRALFCLVALLLLAHPATAQDAERRIALVIGNGAYQAGALTTPADDAGLIAQTLQAAGFDVVGSRDLDQDTLRRALRDFLDKAQASGPNTVAVIYLSGYGLQLEGENYFAPTDARIARDTDVPAEAIRLSDYTRPLAALNLKASVVVVDAVRANPFAQSGAPLAGGLALVDPEPGMLIAFNAAPGTVAPQAQGPYGPYAQALAEMMRDGGLSLPELFDRVRLRVNEVTGGAQVPWHASKVQAPFVFFERAPDAPPPAVSLEQRRQARARPIHDLDPDDAYVAALDRDTLQGYLEFLASYPDHPMARRIRAIVAARREAITWRRTRLDDTPPAYWSYLRRYPEGPHAADARRRLAFLTAALEPPPSFPLVTFDVAPPPPDEVIYVERPVLAFDDPAFAFEPPPPPPVLFLPPPPPDFVVLPPPPPVALFVLPVPEYRPVPVWVRPPVDIAPPPPNNVIYQNVHNTVIINNTTNVVTITNPQGQTKTLPPPPPPPAPAAGAPPGANIPPAGVGPALPPSVARKAIAIQQQPGPTPPPGVPGQPVQPGPPQQAHPLPGAQPLPGPQGQPPVPQQAAHPPAQQPGQPPVHPPGQPPGPPQIGHPPVPQPGQPPAPQPGQPPVPQQAAHPPAQQPGQPPGPQQTGQPPVNPPGQAPAQQPGQPPAPQQAVHPPAQQPVPAPATPSGAQQLEQQRQKQLEQERARQAEQDRAKQLEQQRQQQLQQQRQQQQEQQHQQQLQQQRQQQQEQQRQQQLQQQRQQQQEQQHQQQLQQQRQQQQEQQRQQQLQQQRQQQQEQQRQQQLQQQRQQQLEQQRQQQIQQQQRQQQQQQQQKKPPCGGPGQPPCQR
jgi:uncharacterized caspase-like protein